MIQQTSLKAYNEIKQKIGKKQKEVLEAIKSIRELSLESPTNMEIAKYLGWSINRITPRVLELRKANIIEKEGERPCKITKRTAMTWKPKQD